jgi:hypothetical protein
MIIINFNKMLEGTVSRPMTYGEKAVGLTFNPSGDEKVNIIKMAYANVIDNLNTMRDESRSEKNRLIAIAITEAQSAQMWAVKAITWK